MKVLKIQLIFDYIFIDCPPALSQSTYNAMVVASHLLVPVQMEGLSVNGLAAILGAMEEVKNGRFALNQDLELLGLLPVMVDERPRIVRQAIQYLKDTYGRKVIEHGIRRCIKVNEAQTEMTDLFHYAPYCTAANDYSAVIKEIFGI